MRSIETALDSKDNCFTFLRLIAAVAVCYAHSFPLTLGKGSRDPVTQFLLPFWGSSLGTVAVDLFFVISGFLIAASYLSRDNPVDFIKSRCLRIYPALFVSIFICTFAIGLVASTKSTYEYFLHQNTWSYFFKNTTLVTGVQHVLPGVFNENPYPRAVNGSIWTLPIELTMYASIFIFGITGILRKRDAFNLFFIIILILYLGKTSYPFFQSGHSERFPIVFLIGSMLYVNRKTVPLDFRVILGLAFLTIMLKDQGRVFEIMKYSLFSYSILYISLSNRFRLPNMDKYGDYSYGIYIYAFPAQQMYAYLYDNSDPYLMFFVAITTSSILAIFSWHYIEKPALRFKSKKVFV